MTNRLYTFPLLVLLMYGPVHAGDWPAFRGPHGDGKSAETHAPVEWSETTNVR